MKEKNIQIIFISIFIVIISVIGCLTLLKAEKISYKEGRELVTFATPTYNSVLDGTYFNNLTNAFADQMAFRERFITMYYLLNLQRYTGDVVKGDGNELFLSPQIIQNKEECLENLKNVAKNSINKVAEQVTENGSKFIFLSIPRKDEMMEEYLPKSYIKGTEMYLQSIDGLKESLSENVVLVDAYSVLKEKVDKPFYKTDHHMNIRGAYTLFEWLISYVNSTSNSNIQISKLEDDYTITNQIVNGAFNRKIGQSVKAGEEELTLTYIGKPVTYVRYENGNLSDIPVLGNENTYASAYMGNDMAETIIDTSNDDAPNILFVGSSFTNVLEALSVYKFNKMVSIDYRHNTTGKSIADYVKEHDIDYTVFICSQSTCALDTYSIRLHLGLVK